MKKHTKFLVVFLLLVFLLTGCNSDEFSKPEQIPKAIDRITETTEKAIKDKDVKTARLLWSQISEYGVKAAEMEYKELGETLGKLASTYVNLVQYLETGDEEQLNIFRQNYSEAIEELKEITNTE